MLYLTTVRIRTGHRLQVRTVLFDPVLPPTLSASERVWARPRASHGLQDSMSFCSRSRVFSARVATIQSTSSQLLSTYRSTSS